jgi:hypothetical protein
MTVSKEKALELLDQKIREFETVLETATYESRYNEEYHRIYYGAKSLIEQLFSDKEVKEFSNAVNIGIVVVGGMIDYQKELNDYRVHIRKCISQLQVFKERVINFWDTKPEKTESVAIPFVSMSFEPLDTEINDYVTGILEALEIEFETGERYSKESVPEKVKNRITNSGLFIVIFVKRNRLEDGSFTTSAWLIKEMGIAHGCKKEIIAWVEKGISEKEIANLNYEKEIIYFDRTSIEDLKKATIKFLEALKEHNLV